MNSKRHLRRLFYSMQAVYEKVRGVDFVADVESRKKDYVEYVASTPFVYRSLDSYFKELKIGSEDGIFDVGCGKGRMLTFFVKYPFGHVGGWNTRRISCKPAGGICQGLRYTGLK